MDATNRRAALGLEHHSIAKLGAEEIGRILLQYSDGVPGRCFSPPKPLEFANLMPQLQEVRSYFINFFYRKRPFPTGQNLEIGRLGMRNGTIP